MLMDVICSHEIQTVSCEINDWLVGEYFIAQVVTFQQNNLFASL
jgi:hypothetical protein